MSFLQNTVHTIEVGKGRFLVRLLPLILVLVLIAGGYDFIIFHGLNDAQSMDNAQLARQISRHQGFTTEFLRPQALAQLRDFTAEQSAKTGGSRDLFPVERFPMDTPRIIPDTYNAPGYPLLLAGYFMAVHPDFAEPPKAIAEGHLYSPDLCIPFLNQLLLLLTAGLVFVLGLRLFDDRVAWMALVAFLGSDLMWHFTITGLSTTFLMFLVTAWLTCILEIFCVGEHCAGNEDRSFGRAWLWALVAAILLGLACLTRLNVLVLLLPLLLFLLIMPRGSFLLYAVVMLIVVAMVTPWFVHEYVVSGNPLGSNLTLMLNGQPGYSDNEVFCQTSVPNYHRLFGSVFKKETSGFRWNIEHAWNLLGASPFILLFGASLLHQFKRLRTRLFHWFVVSSLVALVAVNNLAATNPETVGQWNLMVILFPGMLVIGTAYFFILLDRLAIQIRLLHHTIVVSTIFVLILPIILTLTNPSPSLFPFPPYAPFLIKTFGQFVQRDEWVTSDMPWATAWYADRASLWLPDSVAEFQNYYDNVCPTGILMFTPVSWSAPMSNFTTGEYKDWKALANNDPNNAPTSFPLSAHLALPPSAGDYLFWSDRPRWQTVQR